MRRYNYKCTNCDVSSTVIHQMDETIDFCTSCENFDTMVKLLSTPIYNKTSNNTQTVGVLTKEYIEANKKLLEDEKLKAMSETYDPT